MNVKSALCFIAFGDIITDIDLVTFQLKATVLIELDLSVFSYDHDAMQKKPTGVIQN